MCRVSCVRAACVSSALPSLSAGKRRLLAGFVPPPLASRKSTNCFDLASVRLRVSIKHFIGTNYFRRWIFLSINFGSPLRLPPHRSTRPAARFRCTERSPIKSECEIAVLITCLCRHIFDFLSTSLPLESRRMQAIKTKLFFLFDKKRGSANPNNQLCAEEEYENGFKGYKSAAAA